MTKPEVDNSDGDDGGRATRNPDPTMRKPAGKPAGETVPPAGGESMTPADSGRGHPKPGGAED